MPTSVEDRWRAIETIFAALEKAGIARDRCFVDPLVRPVSTNPEQTAPCLEMIAQIRQKGEGAKTVCGLSNISFGLPNRHLLNRTFLSMAAGAGLSAVILDPLAPDIMATVLAAHCLTGEDPFCMNYITAHREGRM